MKSSANVYKNVKRLAKERDIHIYEIEKQVGVVKGFLSRHRTRGLSTTMMIKLSELLDVSIDELVEEPPVTTNRDKFKEVFGFDFDSLNDIDQKKWLTEEFGVSVNESEM